MKEKTVQEAIDNGEIQVGTWVFTNYGLTRDFLFCVYRINEDKTAIVGTPKWLTSSTELLASHKLIRVIGNSKPKIYWKFLPSFVRSMIFPFNKPKLTKENTGVWWL